MRRRQIAFLGFFGIAVMLMLCTIILVKSGMKKGSNEYQKKIGVTYMTMNNPYFEVINQEIKAVVHDKGDVMITRDAALDADMQVRQIKEMIREKVDILLVNAVDCEVIKEGLEEAGKAGIPVLAVDTAVKDEELVEGTILSDNYYAGALIAYHLMEQCDHGNILLLEQKNNLSANERIRGFLDTLERKKWNYHIVSRLDTSGQLEISEPMVSKILDKKKKIDVVMALNDPSALGAMAALDAHHQLKGVYVYGVDGAPEAKTMISEGKMTATASQYPSKTGQIAAGLMYDIIAGKKIKKHTIIPVSLITQKNISRYNIAGWQ